MKKTRQRMYSTENLKLALESVRSGKMNLRQASRHFSVPKTTLHDRVTGKSPDAIGKTGPSPILTIEGENRIAQWILQKAKCGFPLNKKELIETVTKIAKDNGKLNKFKNQKLGQRWYLNFLRRHPEITPKDASIGKSKAYVTEHIIKNWFNDLKVYLEENGLNDIISDPTRIFNGDELGFGLSRKTDTILGPYGSKNLYPVKLEEEKDTLTVSITFNANGNICPPLIVLPSKLVFENLPENWIISKSESGCIETEVFFKYISGDFNRWVDTNHIKKPIILFIDGRKSYISLKLSEFCEKNRIILYALPTNPTNIIQPSDLSVFEPFKYNWKNTIQTWQNQQNDNNILVTKLNFCQFFQDVLDNISMVPNIIEGFRKCGLYPLNPHTIDYSKCIKNLTGTILTGTSIEMNLNEFKPENLKIARKVIESIETKLFNQGINVDIIYKEIDQINQNQGTLTDNIESFPKIDVDTSLIKIEPSTSLDEEIEIEDVKIENIESNDFEKFNPKKQTIKLENTHSNFDKNQKNYLKSIDKFIDLNDKKLIPNPISSEEWRNIIKNTKIPKIKKISKNRKKISKLRKSCALCKNEIKNDADDDLSKDIDCDNCSRWYHLGCTELCHLNYLDAVGKDFLCHFCK